MATNQTHIAENRKAIIEFKNLIPKIKITEVRQIHIIGFWITFVLFLGFIALLISDFCK